MAFMPRKWQQECRDRFLEIIRSGSKTFILEACMGSGKSAMAAWIAKILLEEYEIDHVLVLVPWKSIQGEIDKGMVGAFGQDMGLEARDRFFTRGRIARQPMPEMDATITLYHEVCNQEAIDTLKMWKKEGFTFALICDEIHHTNEIDSSWGNYVEAISTLASFSVFMSGTYFRGDRKPIRCIPLDSTLLPIKDYRFSYSKGVSENVVRAVTTRDSNPNVTIYDKSRDETYVLPLKEIKKELSQAIKQVLDPLGECIRSMIETIHHDLFQTRTKFPDAACLFVCRPGMADNYGNEETAEAQEDKHVHLIADQIEKITGITPVVITHHDKNAPGKIAAFRRGTNPYLVAINMVSEGCDIPRLRSVAFFRYTTSEMLFRQVVGRALRMHHPEDGTAAQIYLFAFPLLMEFASRLYAEAQEGIKDKTCPECGNWPCTCPCIICGKYPCECPPPPPLPPPEPRLMVIDATPVLDGGHVGADHVNEVFVRYATRITRENPAHRHANTTQLGHAFQQFMQMQQENKAQESTLFPLASQANPGAEHQQLCRRINRYVKHLAKIIYNSDYAKAYYNEIELPFKDSFSVIKNTWSVDNIRQISERLERRKKEIFRDA